MNGIDGRRRIFPSRKARSISLIPVIRGRKRAEKRAAFNEISSRIVENEFPPPPRARPPPPLFRRFDPRGAVVPR